MAIRGIRQGIPGGPSGGYYLGRKAGPQGAVTAIPMSNGASATSVSGGGGTGTTQGQYIAAVDSNFSVTSNSLSLATIADGDGIANISGGTAEPAPTGLSAWLDHVFGSTEGNILQRGTSAWQVLAPGAAGQLLASGGGAALNAWATYAPNFSQQNAGTNPTTTSVSPTFVMAGYGFSYTPSKSGKVQIGMSGQIAGTATGGAYALAKAQYGTGTAPSAGASLTGSAVNTNQVLFAPAASGQFAPYTIPGGLTLTPGTAYWFDLAFCGSTTGTVTLYDGAILITEF